MDANNHWIVREGDQESRLILRQSETGSNPDGLAPTTRSSERPTDGLP